jgi:hypothetical protein
MLESGVKAFSNAIAYVLRANRLLSSEVTTGGVFTIECLAPDGTVRWAVDAKNGVTNEALNSILNVYLRAQTQISAWYLGLIDNSGFSTLASADTLASHAGWSESQAYAAATRPQWSPGAAASQAVTNSTTVDFAMNATATIRGLFVASANDKGGTTGVLFSTAAFTGGNQSVNNGDTLKVTYTVSAAAS